MTYKISFFEVKVKRKGHNVLAQMLIEGNCSALIVGVQSTSLNITFNTKVAKKWTD